MKIVINIDTQINPHLVDLHELISQAINKIIEKPYLSVLSHEAVMSRIAEKKLTLGDMDNDMKIPKSKFYHFYDNEMRETIIQIYDKKLVVFTD